MAIGMISSVGSAKEKDNYVDYDVTVVAQTDGVDNWQPYSTAGANCYVYDLPFNQIPGSRLVLDSDIAVLSRGTITQNLLENFSKINAVETFTNSGNVDCIRFYSMYEKPNVDIPVTVRQFIP